MNAEIPLTIPLRSLLFKMGIPLQTEHHGILIYDAATLFPDARQLLVDPEANRWHVPATGQSGDALDLVRHYLTSQGVHAAPRDARRWLRHMTTRPPRLDVSGYAPEECATRYTVEGSLPLSDHRLQAVVRKRGIPLDLAQRYMRQLRLRNAVTRKIGRALGWRNEEGSYSYCNTTLQGKAGPDDITFIRGVIPKPDGVHLFLDIWDYLSLLAERGIDQLQGDTIILNGYGYRQARSWLPDTEDGRRATRALGQILQAEPGLTYYRMTRAFLSHDSLNAMRRAKAQHDLSQ